MPQREKWDERRLARAAKMRADGMTLAEISRYFGMNEASYKRYLQRRRMKSRTVGRAAEGAGPENQ